MAMERGWVPEKGHELDWNDSIQVDSDRVVVDKNWLEGREIQEPKNWNPAEQLITYCLLYTSIQNPYGGIHT